MHVSWLLESEMFPDYHDTLVAEIRRQGHVVKDIPELKLGYHWDDLESSYLKLFPPDACVVFHGSMELGGRLKVEAPWKPAVYCNWNNLDCSTYYCHLTADLLNADYVMLPFGELLRRRKFLFDLFAVDAAIFVRPNSCRKSFTGQLAHWDTFDKDVEFMAFYEVPPEAIVLVSSPKQVALEWRFVVVSHRVVAGSLYKSAGHMDKRPEVDPDALAYASAIAAKDFQPDRAWVLDICKTGAGELRLLEIGSFNVADLYACDMSEVVRNVSALALEDWQGTPER